MLQTDVSNVNQIELYLFSYCFFFMVINSFHLFHLLTVVSFPALLWFPAPRLPSAPSPPTPHILLLKKLHSLSITQLKLHNLHTLHSPSAHLPPRMPFSDVFGVWGLLELLFKRMSCMNSYLKGLLGLQEQVTLRKGSLSSLSHL